MKPRRARPTRRPQGPLHFDLGRAMFVVPNLFTLTSVFCGFWAILLVCGQAGPSRLHQAALTLFFCIFFDMADGRVARMTRTQSEFGVQLDSLADVISFGVAPAVIVYRASLAQLGPVGALVAFLYIAAGAIRLARFNVLAARAMEGASSHFIGLPIPLAAGTLASLVMLQQRMYAPASTQLAQLLPVVLLMSLLMVSGVRYRTFKNVGLSLKSLLSFAALMAAFTALAICFEPAFACLAFFSTYIGLGLLEGAVQLMQSFTRPAEPL